MKYRPEIDGLRAVAVLPVILFHAGFGRFSGGYVGVDVFFVISGYLITTILAGEMEKGDFSIARFYERRARRILPALFLVVLACVPFAWLWMFPAQLKAFALSVGAVALFASNILFWRESGYFDAVAEEKPLLHTWSLAVEEQFYILFPLLLLFLWRFGRRNAIIGIALISAASLLLAEHGWRHHREASFFLLHARAWELGAGALCALYLHGRPARANGPLSLAGLGLILFAVFVYDEHTPFPSLYALVPVAGAALIILFAAPATPAGRLLASRLFVGLGLISYSAYLWHQPLFAFARIRSLDAPGPWLMLALTLATFPLAYLSWRFVERPFRHGAFARRLDRRRVFTAAASASLLLLAFGAFGALTNGAPFRLPAAALALLQVENERVAQASTERCSYHELNPLPAEPTPYCARYMKDGRADVVVIGDSHSAAIARELQEALWREGISSYAAAYVGCIGLPGFHRTDRTSWHACDAYNRAMLDFARTHGTRAVVIASRFPAYVDGTPFDNGEGGVETNMSARFDLVGAAAGSGPERRARVLAALAPAVEAIADDMNVVLVYPVPEAGWNVPHRAARLALETDGAPVEMTTSYARFLERSGEVNAAFDAIDHPHVFKVRPQEVLCDPAIGRCRNAEGDVAYYSDDDHLSNAGVDRILPVLLDQIHRALATPPGAGP